MTENYHTHTYRCHHAQGTDRQFVEAAIAGGIKKLGFSDHVPYDLDERYIPFIRMRYSEAEDYFRSLSDLRDEYRNDIEIFIGFEAEYDRVNFPKMLRTFEGFPLDYLILGQHFILDGDYYTYTGDRKNDKHALETYVSLCIDGMSTGKFTYLAHPDLFPTVVPATVYEREMSRLCSFAAEKGVLLEINALGYYEGRDYPCPLFWEIARKYGCRTVIGCDAHQPGYLDPKLCVDRLESIAAEKGLRLEKSVELIDPLG